MKLKGLETKHIFKRAVLDLVPPEILNRPKQGFGIPINRWINQQLRERVRGTLTEPRTMQRGYVEPRYVNLLLDEHERGRRDHATELWALFMLELWHHVHSLKSKCSRNRTQSGRSLSADSSDACRRRRSQCTSFSHRPPKADLGSRTARGGLLIGGITGLKFCIGLGGTVILARLLTPVDYGLIGMVAIVFNFVSMFQYLGLSTATIKWSDLTHQQVSTPFLV
jgi:hypothetical protein